MFTIYVVNRDGATSSKAVMPIEKFKVAAAQARNLAEFASMYKYTLEVSEYVYDHEVNDYVDQCTAEFLRGSWRVYTKTPLTDAIKGI